MLLEWNAKATLVKRIDLDELVPKIDDKAMAKEAEDNEVSLTLEPS